MSGRRRRPARPARFAVERVVSGGQTGVDRAALDAALALGLACGGWCPKGRRAEDGAIPSRYPLKETANAAYGVRTRRNVRNSDGTLILSLGALDRGTALTAATAKALGRPLLVLDLNGAAPGEARAWLERNRVRVLNVAGPRESRAPGIYLAAAPFLHHLLARAAPRTKLRRRGSGGASSVLSERRARGRRGA